MLDIAEVVELYIAMWNEQDAGRRRELVGRTLTDDATYVDPLAAVEGVDGITALIGAVQGQFPGFSFRLAAGPELHHDRARFTWQLHPADGGEPVATGTDYCTVADDGRLRHVTGFLEQVPAAA
jgi:hypothetical protein